MDFTKLVDAYTARARLLPGLLTVLPISVTVYAWHPGDLLSWNSLGALITGFGGMILLSFIARDLGKHSEARLFKKWGGRPTELGLMHSGPMDPILRQRRHAALRGVFPEVPLPTAKEERANPTQAQQRFAALITLMISHCRNKRKFPLLFEEECNYGFRRNMYGMRVTGMLLSGGTTIALGLLLFIAFSLRQRVDVIAVAVEGVNVAMLLVWLFWVNETTVRRGADLYADRMFEAIDTIRPAA